MPTNKPRTEYQREYAKKRRAKETAAQRKKRLKSNLERYHATKDLKGTKGPKLLIEGDPTEAHTITLPATFWTWLKELGGGKYSAGVFALVKKHKK